MLLIKNKQSPIRGLFYISLCISFSIVSCNLNSYFRYGMTLPLEFYTPLIITLILPLLNSKQENVLFGPVKLFNSGK
ncbi:hypothetical protein AT00_19775 [Pseudoalteromonas lipolytica SCSIO 04301]|nr:hypothetical protein AT00_19775 [Pseudoalteromonas lipolytica SCSIO 04301]